MEYFGTKVGNGLALGNVSIVENTVPKINENKVEDIDNELDKINFIIDTNIKEFNRIINTSKDKDIIQLCEFNKMILMANSLKTKLINEINEYKNSAFILNSYFENKINDLEKSNNNYLKERKYDLLDLKNNLIKDYYGIKKFDSNNLKNDTILVSNEVTPSMLLSGNISKLKGIVSEIGGKTSHVAILCSSLNIPVVFGIKDISKILTENEKIFINAGRGLIETKITEDRIIEIEKSIEKEKIINKELEKFGKNEAITEDGKKYEVAINSGDLIELDKINYSNIDGIGLFRSEFLFLNKNVAPTEEYLFSIYESIAKKTKRKRFIIRTLDIGGDKKCSYIDIENEQNPFLGYRAIRYCIDHKSFFKTSLRAILRASIYGNIHIMYPMISSLEDIIEANKILEEAKEELDKEKIKYDNNIKVGVMVEIPSIAISANEIIKYVDFFSVGTNDLVQYTLAVDRTNPYIAKYYNWFNPGVLKLIKNTINSTKIYDDKFTGMCGEMASDPLGVILLVGFGIDEFSVNINSLNRIKKYITMLNFKETESFVEEILKLDSTKEIEDRLQLFAKEKFGKYYN